MPLDIVTIEHGPHAEVLTQPAAVVAFPLSAQDVQLIDDMKALVLKLQGVGLAAPQIGVSKQIIVYVIDKEAASLRNDAEVVPVTALINPHYTPTPDAKMFQDWEGCFSVRDLSGKVPRYDKIEYTAQLADGSTIKAIATGFTARVLQHEIDHVQGILMTHRLTPDCLQGHPKDMMLIRYKELNKDQRLVVKKYLDAAEKQVDPKDKDRLQYFARIRQIIEEQDK